jgi:hypothetical protein
MNALKIIAFAGLLCGVLDITASGTLFVLKGGTLERILQFIASGAVGAKAFAGGKKTAAAGLFFHFVIAFSAATAYYLLSTQIPFLLTHAVLSGILFGAAVHLFMSLVVVRLSAAPKREFSVSAFLTQLVIHMFLVGLPIALVVRHFW